MSFKATNIIYSMFFEKDELQYINYFSAALQNTLLMIS